MSCCSDVMVFEILLLLGAQPTHWLSASLGSTQMSKDCNYYMYAKTQRTEIMQCYAWRSKTQCGGVSYAQVAVPCGCISQAGSFVLSVIDVELLGFEL